MKFKAKTERSDQKKEGEHMVRSIVEALAEYAKVQPDKLFLADGKVELTYLDAWKCVYGYAVHLRELGIRRGDHVVVRNSQNAQLVISQLAIQLVGAVFVPIEKNAADDRIAEIIGAVEAKLYLAAKQGEFSCKWETIKDVLSYKWTMPQKCEYPKAMMKMETVFAFLSLKKPQKFSLQPEQPENPRALSLLMRV